MPKIETHFLVKEHFDWHDTDCDGVRFTTWPEAMAYAGDRRHAIEQMFGYVLWERSVTEKQSAVFEYAETTASESIPDPLIVWTMAINECRVIVPTDFVSLSQKAIETIMKFSQAEATHGAPKGTLQEAADIESLVCEKLYRFAYSDHFKNIATIDGWPTVSHATWEYILRKVDAEWTSRGGKRPMISPIFNSGFSHDLYETEKVPEWQIRIAPAILKS